MDAPSGAYGKSNWAAAIAYGASQNLTADEFQSEFEELGARKMANQLRLDDQPKATRLKAAQEQKALVDRHFATSDLANLDLMEATARSGGRIPLSLRPQVAGRGDRYRRL